MRHELQINVETKILIITETCRVNVVAIPHKKIVLLNQFRPLGQLEGEEEYYTILSYEITLKKNFVFGIGTSFTFHLILSHIIMNFHYTDEKKIISYLYYDSKLIHLIER